MRRVRFSPEQIIGNLREAEVLLGQGGAVTNGVQAPSVALDHHAWIL